MDQRILNAAQQAQDQAWLPPPTSQYHAIISLLLSQRISLAQSRNLRRSLYTALGTNEFTPDIMATLKPELKALIPSKFHPIIDQVTALALTNHHQSDLVSEVPRNLTSPTDSGTRRVIEWTRLSQISGIGPWTIKGAKLMIRENEEIFLAEDLYIRQRLRELYNLPAVPTIRQAMTMAQVWAGSWSLVSRFLWRLRPEGAKKLQEGQPIQSTDLI
jgi:3-methyladenine DNA glycosylase/8-oxoguanine DNA glycosylase